MFTKIKFVAAAFIALFATESNAQLAGDGYYRVKNNGTGYFIYINDNKGSLNVSTTSADMLAIQLYDGIENAVSEASSVLYFEKHGDQWDIQSQTTGIYDIISRYISITQTAAGIYQVFATQGPMTSYLYDSGAADKSIPYHSLGTTGTPANNRWKILPIDNSTDNYFGVKPTLTIGNDYYAPFYAAFPFKFESTGMKAYKVTRIADNGCAIIEEIKEEVIPALTPVIIKCASTNTSANKLTLLRGSYPAITGNVLKGNLFDNDDHDTKSAIARVKYDKNTMRVLCKTKDGKLGFNSDNSSLHICDFDGDGIRYLNRNQAYLPVPAGTSSELTLMTEEEYLATSITTVETSANGAETYFSADGKRLSAPQKGLNIVKMSDGSTKKVVLQ